MMREYRVKITVRNNLLLSAIEAAGYKSQAEFARAAGLSVNRLNGVVGLREAPIGRKGKFTEEARRIMEVLGAAPSDLWTDEQLYVKLKRNSASAAVGVEEVKALLGDAMAPTTLCLPDEAVEKADLLRDIECALSSLPPRERAVVRLRFGIGTDKDKSLLEVGDALGVSSERVRQIEMKALRMLRKPSVSSGLLVHLDEEQA